MRLAKEAGFSKGEIVGNTALRKDMREYSLGVVSAALDVMPARLREAIRGRRRRFQGGAVSHVPDEKGVEEKIIAESIAEIRRCPLPDKKKQLKDYLSSAIILFGYAGTQFHEKH
jgi:hypothetical protein